MSIEVGCTNCGTQFKARDEFAGRQGKCPKCKAAIVVPTTTRVASSAVERAKPQAAVAAPAIAPPAVAPRATTSLVGQIEPVKSPWGYKASILLVTIVMILLPVVYIAIIGGVAFLMYFHATHSTGILTAKNTSSRNQFGAFVVYLTPLVAGAVLILFMIKPLFAKSSRRDKPRSLTREGEPKLFVFVDQLCEVVGAPKPRRIDVDCNVNASASFRRGWLSMFGSDLVLTIGLPLVAGLNMQQFAGVLAHEFGHFTQGWGMRLSYIIRSISLWFTRVVYERDAWDQQLIDWSRTSEIRIQAVLMVVRFAVFITRKVLWVLMMVGHAVSGILLRQMEYDADMHEIRLAGSPTFESTCRRLAVLNVATQGAFVDLQHWYKEGRLGDNFPRLMLANAEQLPPKVLAAVNEGIDKSETGWLDTHPADSARLQHAREQKAAGLFHSDLPAMELFSNFHALAKTSTFDFYKAMLGNELKITDLHSTDTLLEKQQREGNTQKALGRYFQGMFRTLRPLPMPKRWAVPPKDLKPTIGIVKDGRERMLAALAEYRAAYKAFDELDTQLVQAAEDIAFIESGLKPPERKGMLRLKTKDDAKRRYEHIQSQIDQLSPLLRKFEGPAAMRLMATLELLQSPQVSTKLKATPDQLQRANDFLSFSMVITDSVADLVELRNQHAALCALLNNLTGREQNQKFIQTILQWAGILHQRVGKMYEAMSIFQYPFEHGRGEVTVAKYCVETLPAKDDVGGILNAAGAFLDRLPTLFVRLMAQLAMKAEKVEFVLGLQPLPEPKEEVEGAETAVEVGKG